MALAKLGRLITFIPHPVTTGFTAGIAVVIGTIQLKDLLGLQLLRAPETYVERWRAMWEARATVAWPEIAIGLFTLGLLLIVPRIQRRFPAPLVALAVAWGGRRPPAPWPPRRPSPARARVPGWRRGSAPRSPPAAPSRSRRSSPTCRWPRSPPCSWSSRRTWRRRATSRTSSRSRRGRTRS